MSNGILCFANNNGKIDYLKQAIFLANRAKQYLNLPVSIATSSKRDLDYLYKEQASIFDHIIEIPDVYDNTKRYYNGSLNYEYLLFKNYNNYFLQGRKTVCRRLVSLFENQEKRF